MTIFFVGEFFIPHGHCYLWKPSLVGLHVISDSLIALAYYSIPLTLFYFVRKRQDLPFSWIFLWFAIFIVSCGTTHVLEVWTLWHPTYWFSGAIKAATAIASLFTAFELIPLVPQALALPSPALLEQTNQELQTQIQQRQQIESDLRQSQNQLEQRVQERTAELERANAQLKQEIIDRKRAEADLLQKNAILSVINESAPTPIFVKDRQGRIIYANPATLEVLGKSAAEVIGYRDCDLYASADAARVTENDQRIMELGQTEVVEESPDGIRTFLGMKAPYRNESGEVIGLIGISNDITDRVQLERDRERILQQEQAARAAAERANQIKDEFLAVLSHELRTPLNPILGWTRLLQTGKLDAAKTAKALKTIERNAQLQTQLIDDLLDVSRISQGKLTLSVAPVNLEFVIAAGLTTVQFAAEAKGIKIQTAIESLAGQISGDAKRLQQVIWNLLSNAIKFTPPGGRVEVRLTQVERHAQIQVIDTGKGIHPNFLPNVFESFRQEDGTITRKFGGLGLGLTIARQIVELHGGTIHAVSPGEGQGATFVVQLPILLPALEVSSVREAPNHLLNLSGAQILIVEDDADSRDFITFVLEQTGATVMSMASASEALQVLKQIEPDVLVSDIEMPEMDGYLLMQKIRALPSKQNADILAIALTAHAGELDQQQARSVGFQHHLVKPIDPEQLVALIARLMNRSTT